jgi:hypothetical protein
MRNTTVPVPEPTLPVLARDLAGTAHRLLLWRLTDASRITRAVARLAAACAVVWLLAHDRPEISWLPLVATPAVLGSGLALIHPARSVTDVLVRHLPNDRMRRFVLQVFPHADRLRVNVPGVCEGVGAVLLILALGWPGDALAGHDPHGLFGLVLVDAYVWTFTMNIVSDPAWEVTQVVRWQMVARYIIPVGMGAAVAAAFVASHAVAARSDAVMFGVASGITVCVAGWLQTWYAREVAASIDTVVTTTLRSCLLRVSRKVHAEAKNHARLVDNALAIDEYASARSRSVQLLNGVGRLVTELETGVTHPATIPGIVDSFFKAERERVQVQDDTGGGELAGYDLELARVAVADLVGNALHQDATKIVVNAWRGTEGADEVLRLAVRDWCGQELKPEAAKTSPSLTAVGQLLECRGGGAEIKLLDDGSHVVEARWLLLPQ